jgi:sigma-B regulation protein RsbQ
VDVTTALFVRLEAKPGKEADVAEFLRGALPVVEDENKTVTWFALPLGPGTFGIYDAFPDEEGRQAHLSGRVAAALTGRADELFAAPPSIEQVDVLAATLPHPELTGVWPSRPGAGPAAVYSGRYMDSLVRNNVTVSGRSDGRTMVFAHGFGCDQGMWRHVAPAFEDAYRVVQFDHIGCGGSDPAAYDPGRHASLDGYADDVLDIADALDLTDAVLVGHSVSSMIGVLAAIREPSRFSELVLVTPSPRYLDEDGYVGGFAAADVEGLLDYLADNFVGWADTMAPVVMGNPERPELGAELAESFCRADPKIAEQFARVTFLSDNRADLPAVRARCLVLQCSDDALAPESVGRYVHEHLPDSEFVLLAATGHCPQLSAPAETVAAIKAFL